MIATIMLQMFSPVTPVEPIRSKIKPPTKAPTIPSAMLSQKPCPCLSTILLPMKPAIRPNMIQLMIPMDYLPSRDVTMERAGRANPTWSFQLVDDEHRSPSHRGSLGRNDVFPILSSEHALNTSNLLPT